MVESHTTSHIHESVQKSLQANKEHQQALNAYIAKLEAELKTVEKLIDSADAEPEEEPELEVPGFIFVPGAVRAMSLISSTELLSPDSPFYEDALRRSRYKSVTDIHPMKTRELEALAEAVRTENYRKMVFDAQIEDLPAFADINQQSPKSLERNTDGLDWDRIAEKVSRVSMATRTGRECEIRWLGDRHPDFNHEAWNEEELGKLRSLISECKGSQPDWVDIAEKLGTNRTPLECMRRGMTRKSHTWTATSDARLLKAIRMYGHNWSLVARYVSEDATPTQCSNRYQRTLDPSVKRINWTPEEDARLRIAVAAHGQSWVDVAAAMPGRTNDQCRDRWNDQLNPTINKAYWSQDEDKALLDAVEANANATWKEISELLGTSRTDAMCRNRFLRLQRGLKDSSVTFSVARQPSVDSAATPSTEWSGTGATTPSECPSQSPGVLLPNAPLLLEHCLRAEGTPLLFLEPVVSSNPALFDPHPRSNSAKPIMPSVSNTPDRLSTPGSSISTSSKKGKRKQKQTSAANNGNLEEGPRKRRKFTRPKQAGMDGQLFVTFGPTSTNDSGMSTPAHSQGNASGRTSAQPMDVGATE
ncbi:hypothetical protein SCLCIDRAFT_20855 [Scleroderma citrinum Foug A]|uniref:Uncharacterized protein n=1 Tax=Scleroderma citrinum Foug A TaxID=1036808 RepID=A0A0C3ASF3_9AGAM|nr:hypothetical protein SCLCIDRAFT_20855 [Scleroderma citrinum Foug A]